MSTEETILKTAAIVYASEIEIINYIGPSLFDASEQRQEEYRKARKTIQEAGFYMELGDLKIKP